MWQSGSCAAVLPADLIASASGAPVSAAPLLDYLEEKFGALTA